MMQRLRARSSLLLLCVSICVCVCFLVWVFCLFVVVVVVFLGFFVECQKYQLVTLKFAGNQSRSCLPGAGVQHEHSDTSTDSIESSSAARIKVTKTFTTNNFFGTTTESCVQK